jgi:hypothetical protein
MKLTEKERISLRNVEELYYKGNLSNAYLVSLLKLIVSLLQLKRVSKYAKDNNITSQGARKFRETIKLCNYTLIIDND